MHEKIEVTMMKSFIGKGDHQKKILAGLGLKKIGDIRVHKDNNCIRGMINKVRHLIKYKLMA